MSEFDQQIHNVETRAREITSHASGMIRFLARAGYAANGITYILAGILAFLAAFSFAAGRTAGSADTLALLLDHPFGWIALSFIAAGLSGYALWCFVLALADPDRMGRDWTGLRFRFVALCKGFVNLGLVAIAIGTLVGVVHSTPDRDPIEQWTVTLMSLPLGIAIVAIVGASVIASGGFQLHQSWRTKRLDRQLNFDGCSPALRTTLGTIGRVGVAARGFIFLIIGLFFILAAYHANPHEAKGVGRALRFVKHQHEGRWLLAIVALGLISYGLFQFVLARYRRIDPA